MSESYIAGRVEGAYHALRGWPCREKIPAHASLDKYARGYRLAYYAIYPRRVEWRMMIVTIFLTLIQAAYQAIVG